MKYMPFSFAATHCASSERKGNAVAAMEHIAHIVCVCLCFSCKVFCGSEVSELCIQAGRMEHQQRQCRACCP